MCLGLQETPETMGAELLPLGAGLRKPTSIVCFVSSSAQLLDPTLGWGGAVAKFV